jgi:hypothetical protein
MPGDDFFRTAMGRRFYEATMPKIADQLERLNVNLEAWVAEFRRSNARAHTGTDLATATSLQSVAARRDTMTVIGAETTYLVTTSAGSEASAFASMR